MSLSLELTKEKDNFYSSNVSGSYCKRSIYGGIFLSQSIMAAYHSVDPAMNLHSFQVYFITRGDSKLKVKYHVESVMNGKSYVKRSVSVIQNEIIISKVMLSFKIEELSTQFSFVPKYPSVINHNQCPLLADVISQKLSKPLKEATINKLNGFSDWLSDFPIDVKPIDPEVQSFTKENPSNKIANWVKLRDTKLLDFENRSARYAFLGFISDFSILLPITTIYCFQTVGMMLSLDHVMWFHSSKFDPNQWLLIEAECNLANNGTTLNNGRIWSENGILLATFMQEGIIRPPIAKT